MKDPSGDGISEFKSYPVAGGGKGEEGNILVFKARKEEEVKGRSSISSSRSLKGAPITSDQVHGQPKSGKGVLGDLGCFFSSVVGSAGAALCATRIKKQGPEESRAVGKTPAEVSSSLASPTEAHSSILPPPVPSKEESGVVPEVQ